MEGDATTSSEKSRTKRGVDPLRLLAEDRNKRTPNTSRGGKTMGRNEARSRNGRGKRGSGKLNGPTRASEINSSNCVAPLKPNPKIKSEPREPSLLETGLKVIVRRLPPALPEKILFEAISPWISPEKYEWFQFIPGKISDNPAKPRVHSRAYIRFFKQDDVSEFIQHFNGHKFVDAKGVQDQCVVEFAPYLKTPKTARPDAKQGTIEEDPEFLSFVASLTAEKEISAQPQAASQTAVNEDPKSTPLIEFLRARKAEQAEARHAVKSSKPNMVVLSRKGKGAESSKPLDQEAIKFSKDDKKPRKPKPVRPTKVTQPNTEPKVENDESSSGRRPRRRIRKKAAGKEDTSAPFAPTHILKPPSKGQDPEWPEPGPNNSSCSFNEDSNPTKASNVASSTSKDISGPSNSAPVRHVFKLTNGCLTQSTCPNGSTEPTPKAPRRRRRPPPATSKPQTAS